MPFKIRLALKIKAAVLGISLLSSPLAWSEDPLNACPLRNPFYKNLRESAIALEKVAQLPPSCGVDQELQATQQQVNTALGDLARIRQGQTPGVATEVEAMSQTAQAAATGLVKLGQAAARLGLGNRDCGRALLGPGGYLETLVDTMNGVVPYLFLFNDGKPNTASLFLGTSVVGAAAKVFLLLFRSSNFDMSKTEQRQRFIDNACGYWQLRRSLEVIRKTEDEPEKVFKPLTSEQKEMLALKMRLEMDRGIFEQLKANVKAETPAGLVCDYRHKMLESSGDDRRFPAGLRRAVRELFEENSFEAIQMKRIDRLGKPVLSADEAACAANTRAWIAQIDGLMAAAAKKWDQSATAQIIKRSNELRSFSAKGSEIEMSELLLLENSVLSSLFGRERRGGIFSLFNKPKSPAESWVENNVDEAKRQIKHFKTVYSKYRKSDQSKQFATREGRETNCQSLQGAIQRLDEADLYLDSSRFFCTEFSSIINQSSFPSMSQACFGEYDKEGKLKEQSVLKKVTDEVRGLKNRAQALSDLMAAKGCVTEKTLD